MKTSLPKTALTDGVVSLRKVSADDAEILYRLRMDPLSLPMFRNTGVVPFKWHQKMVRATFRGLLVHHRSRAENGVQSSELSSQ